MLSKLEIKRQLVHMCYGFIIVALLFFNVVTKLTLIIGLLLFTALVATTAVRKLNVPGISWLLDKLERDTEKRSFRAKGLVFYSIGAALTILIFDKTTAMGSIMILAVGDSTCRLAGARGYLKHPWNSAKFIEGVIGGGILATIAAAPFVGLLSAFFAAAIAMFIESLDLKIKSFKIDDNLTIPLIAGTIIWVLHFIFMHNFFLQY